MKTSVQSPAFNTVVDARINELRSYLSTWCDKLGDDVKENSSRSGPQESELLREFVELRDASTAAPIECVSVTKGAHKHVIVANRVAGTIEEPADDPGPSDILPSFTVPNFVDMILLHSGQVIDLRNTGKPPVAKAKPSPLRFKQAPAAHQDAITKAVNARVDLTRFPTSPPLERSGKPKPLRLDNGRCTQIGHWASNINGNMGSGKSGVSSGGQHISKSNVKPSGPVKRKSVGKSTDDDGERTVAASNAHRGKHASYRRSLAVGQYSGTTAAQPPAKKRFRQKTVSSVGLGRPTKQPPPYLLSRQSRRKILPSRFADTISPINASDHHLSPTPSGSSTSSAVAKKQVHTYNKIEPTDQGDGTGRPITKPRKPIPRLSAAIPAGRPSAVKPRTSKSLLITKPMRRPTAKALKAPNISAPRLSLPAKKPASRSKKARLSSPGPTRCRPSPEVQLLASAPWLNPEDLKRTADELNALGKTAAGPGSVTSATSDAPPPPTTAMENEGNAAAISLNNLNWQRTSVGDFDIHSALDEEEDSDMEEGIPETSGAKQSIAGSVDSVMRELLNATAPEPSMDLEHEAIGEDKSCTPGTTHRTAKSASNTDPASKRTTAARRPRKGSEAELKVEQARLANFKPKIPFGKMGLDPNEKRAAKPSQKLVERKEYEALETAAAEYRDREININNLRTRHGMCPICYERVKYLRAHVNSDHFNGAYCHKCPQCNRIYCTTEERDTHLMNNVKCLTRNQDVSQVETSDLN